MRVVVEVTPCPPLLKFTVLGQVKPKGSKRAIIPRGAKKPVVIDSDPKGLAAWQRDIRAGAQRAVEGLGDDWPGLLTGPLWVRTDFVLPRPASHKPNSWPVGQTTGDGDKLTRAAWDALSKVVFGDDAQVVLWSGTKVYGPAPGVTIAVGVVV